MQKRAIGIVFIFAVIFLVLTMSVVSGFSLVDWVKGFFGKILGNDNRVSYSPIDSALIIHVPFDEGAGANSFMDLNGNVAASCSGNSCPATGLPGKMNNSASFDGVDDFTRSSKSDLNIDLDKITLSAWVKRGGDLGSWQGVVGKFYYSTSAGIWCENSDANRDGKVNDYDVDIISGEYGRTDCSNSNSWCNNADGNKDGNVDDYDYDTMSGNYGRTDCAASFEFGSWAAMLGDKNNSNCKLKINNAWKESASSANTIPVDNNWHLITCVYDGSAIINYVDGIEKSRVSASGSVTGSTNLIYVGATGDGTVGQNYFKGMIDDVRIYTRDLSAAEVSELAGINSCNDSDGGKVYDVKGTTTDSSTSKTDHCDDGRVLIEYYCQNNAVQQDNYNCPDVCNDGVCADIPISQSYNTKNMSKYSTKEAFLISDKNWKDVLPLVPLTTWTGNETCQKGYGTPSDVCVYPTLIYHEEEDVPQSIQIDLDNIRRFFSFEINTSNPVGVSMFSSTLNVNRLDNFTITILLAPYHIPTFLNYVRLNGSSSKFQLNSQPFIMINTYLQAEGYSVMFNFTYLGAEAGDKSFDADSIIHFMQQYNPSKLTIFGNTPQELDNLLVAAPQLGAGLASSNINRIPTSNYLSYWTNYTYVVYVEDNYELSLLASTYASLINAPLIIKGTSLDISANYAGKNIVCVGNAVPSEGSCAEAYDLKQLQEKYVRVTNTDKMIIVNPNDLNLYVNESFQPEKSTNPIREIYGKTSLASPILASTKHEVLLSTQDADYKAVDGFIDSKFSKLFNVTYGDSLCALGSECSSGFYPVGFKRYVFNSSVLFNVSIDASSGSYYLQSSLSVFDCDSDVTDVEIYNNGHLLKKVETDCIRSEDSYNGDRYLSIQVSDIQRGVLEFKTTGAKFLSSEPHIAVYDFNANWQQIYYCNARDYKGCILQPLVLEYLSANISNSSSYFNFDNLAIDKKQYIIFYKSGPTTDFGIYVNNFSIGNISIYGYGAVQIPEFALNDRISIQIVPMNCHGCHFNMRLGLHSLDYDSKYITIISSPDAITFSKPSGRFNFNSELQWEVDGRVYGSKNNYFFIDFFVGRIMGITTSDVSAYLARDLLFNKLQKNKDALLVIPEDHQEEILLICQELGIPYSQCGYENRALREYALRYFWNETIRSQFDKQYLYSGWDEVNSNQENIHNNYSEVYLRLFDNHGWTGGFGGMMSSDYLMMNKVYLKPGFVVALACSTCAYSNPYGSRLGNLFCAQGIRRGVLAQQGAVDVSYWHKEFDNILYGTILQNETIGQSFREARNEEFLQNSDTDNYYALLGDPTWRPRWW